MTKLKTYTESKKKKPFDWNKFLNKVKYSRKELDEAYASSGDWVTCACGTQCSIIPRWEEGTPKDSYLKNFGYTFSSYIYHMSQFKQDNPAFGKAKEDAKLILELIENRSKYLIESLYAKEKMG